MGSEVRAWHPPSGMGSCNRHTPPPWNRWLLLFRLLTTIYSRNTRIYRPWIRRRTTTPYRVTFRALEAKAMSGLSRVVLGICNAVILPFGFTQCPLQAVACRCIPIFYTPRPSRRRRVYHLFIRYRKCISILSLLQPFRVRFP